MIRILILESPKPEYKKARAFEHPQTQAEHEKFVAEKKLREAEKWFLKVLSKEDRKYLNKETKSLHKYVQTLRKAQLEPLKNKM